MPTFANCKLIARLFVVRRTGAKKDLKGRKALIGGFAAAIVALVAGRRH
ncbi:hypothetical protein ACLRDC_09640 [Gluconacetobacter sacchari]